MEDSQVVQKLNSFTGSLLYTVIILAQFNVAHAGPLGTSDPAACTQVGTTLTCTGNLSGGVEADGPAIETLNVNTLNQAITPANGVDGINFSDNAAATGVTINSDTGVFGIVTTDDDAEGINSSESGDGDQSITSIGNISTDGARSEGIVANESGDGFQTINSSGNISTLGTGSDGIDASEDGNGDVTIISSGNITTLGNNADGIQSDESGEGNQSITSIGDISTAGTSSDGIQANENDAGNQTITSTGDIFTAEDNADGIVANENDDGDQTISATGNITTLNADGINASENGVGIQNVTAAGSISTAGNGNGSIEADESGEGDQLITFNGDLATTGNDAEGIFATEDNEGNQVISTTGSISTSGARSEGIEAIETGDGDLIVTSTSNIETQGTNADGIQVSEAGDGDITVTSAGNITVNGANASGVFVTADAGTQTIVNLSGGDIQGGTGNGAGVNFENALGTNTLNIFSGTSLSALSGVAIRGSDGNDTVSNAGIINGNIELGAGDDTLNLLAGSQVNGIIDGGADNDSANIFSSGLGPSTSISFSNFENINLTSDMPGVVVGNTAITVDPTGYSYLGEVVNEVVSDIHQNIHQRLVRTKDQSLEYVQVASLNNSSGIHPEIRSGATWGKIFGSRNERDGDKGVLDYEHDYYGVVGGAERDFGSKRVGLLVGYASSDVDTELQSFDTDVDSYFIGAYQLSKLGLLDLTLSVLGGYEDYNNKRLVVGGINGTEEATSDFNNYFISPSVTLSADQRINESLELRTFASLVYTAAFFDSYTESGTTASNLDIDSRNVQALYARSQIAGAYFIPGGEVELRAGLDSRFMDEDRVEASLAGTNFQFANTDDDEVMGAYVGAGMRVVDVDNNLSLVADVEYRAADGGEEQLSGSLGLEYSF